MQPKIIAAKAVASFEISPKFSATLFSEIESAGTIQYYYVLVVFGEDEQPCIFTASEWSKFSPEYKDAPVFGVFLDDQHMSQDSSSDWLNPALFVLKSIQFCNEHLGLSTPDLSDGEAWALTRIMKGLNEGGYVEHHNSYRLSLQKYGDQLTKYLRRTIFN